MRWILVLVALASCKHARPLNEAIVGEWEVLCRTDREATASCLGKEGEMRETFGADGTLVLRASYGAEFTGRWTLAGDELTLAYEAGGMRTEEHYRMRMEGDSLVMWYPRGGFGKVLGRVGAAFEPAASEGAGGTHELGGVRYTIDLPGGYRLARDDNRRQRWAPAGGDGLIVDLHVSERSQTEVDGKWITRPCNPYDYGGVLSSAQTIDGKERDTSIGLMICLDGTDLAIDCSAGHTRGYLEPSEKDAALALCKTLAVVR